MKHRLQHFAVTVLAVTIAACSPIVATEDSPVCAVIEVDEAGHTWINGAFSDLSAIADLPCAKHSVLVLAPDFMAPSNAFAETLIETRAGTRTVKVFMPSLRREIENLFGFDVLAKCQPYSGRMIEPIPAMGSVVAPEIVNVRGASTLDVLPTTPIGAVDEIANSEGAYTLASGLALVVRSSDLETRVGLRESDFFYPPPPKVEEKEIAGVTSRHAVGDAESCVYPDFAKH